MPKRVPRRKTRGTAPPWKRSPKFRTTEKVADRLEVARIRRKKAKAPQKTTGIQREYGLDAKIVGRVRREVIDQIVDEKRKWRFNRQEIVTKFAGEIEIAVKEQLRKKGYIVRE